MVRNQLSTIVEVNIRSLIKKLDYSVENGTTKFISFPSRGVHNQLYVPELERFVLKHARPTRSHLSEEAAKDKVS
ncbi:DNA topoisomerase 6 subunit A [Orobanche hederae]